MLLFVVILIKKSREEHLQTEDKLLEDVKYNPLYKSIASLIAGVLLLKFGADSLVDGAIKVASFLMFRILKIRVFFDPFRADSSRR